MKSRQTRRFPQDHKFEGLSFFHSHIVFKAYYELTNMKPQIPEKRKSEVLSKYEYSLKKALRDIGTYLFLNLKV